MTADLDKVTPGSARYAALLTPQGKIIADFIVVEGRAEDGGGFFLDCPRALAPTLVQRLNFYKLRAKVIVEDLSETLGVLAVWDGAGTTRARPVLCRPAPPRARAALHAPAAPRGQGGGRSRRELRRCRRLRGASHRARRAARRLDFIYGDAFPHEADMDQLGGVDFDKGCFVGQEVVSRMEHRGTARTRVVPVAFDGLAAGGRRRGDGRRQDARHDRLRLGAAAAGSRMLRLDRVADALAAGDAADRRRHRRSAW